MSLPAAETRGRVPELDGVRGLAILLVVLWHYVAVPLQTAPGPAASFAFRSLRLAWSGVDLFFVLSGFLIGGILLDQRAAPGYFKAFYARRFCRIVPLYAAWLALFFLLLAAAPGLAVSPALGHLFRDPLPAWSYATFTQNLVMARWETLGPGWLAITWSLAIEEQLYLLLPLMVRFLAPSRLRLGCALLAVAAPVFRALAQDHGAFAGFVLMPCRADSLLLGMLCACLVRHEGGRRALARARGPLYGVLGAVGAGLAALCFLDPAPFEKGPYVFSFLAVLWAAFLLLAVSERRGPVSGLVRGRWLRGLGLLAYGVYLMHQAVAGLAHGLLLGREPAFGSAAEVAVTLAAFAATLGLAALSWRFFEKPLVAWGHTVSYDDARRPAAAPVGEPG